MKSQYSGKILIIEDDQSLAYILKRFLELKNFKVDIKTDEKSALESALNKNYNLFVININLPLGKGLNILQKIRDRGISTPAISMADKSNLESEIKSYKAGANLFHNKPINYQLLEIQIYSLLKIKEQELIRVNELEIDLSTKQIYKNGCLINLTKSEFNVLLLFIKSQGRLFSREDIIRRAFDSNRDSQYNSVDTLISRLRKKIGDLERGSIVETVFKSGYRINSEYVSNS